MAYLRIPVKFSSPKNYAPNTVYENTIIIVSRATHFRTSLTGPVLLQKFGFCVNQAFFELNVKTYPIG